MNKASVLLAKSLYAILFLVALPAALWFWAEATESLVRYPAIASEAGGWGIATLGAVLMLWGMLALWLHGRGLPMNGFPPPVFVRQGPYRVFQHPIYWGFGMLVLGVSVLSGSASGFWLVTPVTILGMVALVWGYEEIDLRRRFPDAELVTLTSLPADASGPPLIRERVAALAWVLLVLAAVYCLAAAAELSSHNTSGSGLPALYHPFWPWLGLVGVSVPAWLLNTRASLRHWARASLIGLVLSCFTAFVAPAAEAVYLASGMVSAPFFLVLVAAFYLYQEVPRRPVALASAVAIALAGLAQLGHSWPGLPHLFASLAIFILAAYHVRVWSLLRKAAEWVANSWQEWVFGPVRVINHGIYIGVGAFSGILLAGILAGRMYAWAILVFAFIVIVTSALWGQFVEGSEKLKRPFGYYGALVGIPFGSLAVWYMGVDAWVSVAVISVVMPWVQAIGRLRCLVNGCCHGSPVTDPAVGIRYVHYRSRVCHLSNMKGVLLHPTQLYSFLWLFFVGFVLLALWHHRLPPSFLFGLYLILTGIGRFVEEAYRGEVQTKILRGLRLYQWTAIASVAVGVLATVMPTRSIVVDTAFGWEVVASALLGGLFACFAMGIDFPYSNRRFSRLV